MATFVTEINSSYLSSEIPFSKSFSDVKTSQPSRKYRISVLMVYISVELTIKFNSTQFKLHSYTKFGLLVLGAVKIFK